MHADCRGLPLTAANADAVAAFDATVAAYLDFARDTGDRLKATLKADPAMPLAHVLRGAFFLLMGKPTLLAKAAEASAAANERLDGATARERRHAQALAAWCRGDFEGALHEWEAILADAPRDIVALKLAHYLHSRRASPRPGHVSCRAAARISGRLSAARNRKLAESVRFARQSGHKPQIIRRNA